ncbi:hypothetical protein PR002_g29991 [Phytophthora rubi]|uniref:Uncharacterized protein n=1 Tax=Phytophthora rubi TaxID=129364 RepID=A0A6A3GW30_9STRA|nr:hypothetical protein PR002_g29991 [Phytophthora rubi]
MASALADGKLQLPTSKQCPASVPKLVMVSALADGKLRLPTSKVRGCCSVRQAWPMLVMVSALADDKLRLPTSKQCPASVADAGDGVRARGWQAATAHQQDAWLLQCPAAWSKLVMGVRATNAKLPSPSRRFMTPEVAGRRCCY